VPIIKTQHAIATAFFLNDILYSDGWYYKRSMVGRTAAFLDKRDASLMLRAWSQDGCKNSVAALNPKFVLLRVRLSGDLMSGIFNGSYFSVNVVAGRIMDIQGEEVVLDPI
jgi:hypothetical protein